MFTQSSVIGIIGSGAMGSGIAQVAATAGHKVLVYDNNQTALDKAKKNLLAGLEKLTAKNKISLEQSTAIAAAHHYVSGLADLSECDLIIEAIVENLDIKKAVFSELENLCKPSCALASNTSSLSITSIAAACKQPQKVLGVHFFNPATLMPLVEIIPGVATDLHLAEEVKKLTESWGKTCVMAKDTPGFIVNRVARPFYSEALRIAEEGIADLPTIDWAMKEIGGFRMGPFELMDLIGHDVNYVVTETVWKQFYYDPKFKPALSQKRLLEAGFLGRKSGRGFYQYHEGATMPEPNKDPILGKKILERVLAMLINEAADTVYLGVASAADVDLAMTKGVNYPKGLLRWADEWGIKNVCQTLRDLQTFYEEDRYRLSPALKHKLQDGTGFY